jgi:hypothetical protein
VSLLVSASQVSLFRDGPDDDGCKRKYALRYVAGLEEPGTKSQELGKEVDDTQLQPYLKDGTPLDLTRESGLIAAAGLKFLPQPKHPGLEVQKGFVMPSPSKLFSWRGYLDLWLPQRGLPDFESDGPYPIVSDFKTTTDCNKWAKTPEKLAIDPQAQIYATWAMWTTKARVVDLVWIYLQTRGTRKAKRVHLRVDAKHVFEQFRGLEETGREIYELRTRADVELKGVKDKQAAIDWALSLPPNTNACDKFGGCPHQHLCKISSNFIDSIDIDIGRADRRFLPVMQDSIDLFADLQVRSEAPVVGINPPEKSLPLADPTGAVTAPPPVAASEAPAETPKAKRGRKPKAAPVEEPIQLLGRTFTKSDAEQIEADLAEIRGVKMAGDAAAGIDVSRDTDRKLEGAEFLIAWAELGSAVQRFLSKAGK